MKPATRARLLAGRQIITSEVLAAPLKRSTAEQRLTRAMAKAWDGVTLNEIAPGLYEANKK